jgi:hypothetical protein
LTLLANEFSRDYYTFYIKLDSQSVGPTVDHIEAKRLSKESFVRSVNLFSLGFEMYANKKAPRSIGLKYELLSYACTVPIVPYFEEYLNYLYNVNYILISTSFLNEHAT